MILAHGFTNWFCGSTNPHNWNIGPAWNSKISPLRRDKIPVFQLLRLLLTRMGFKWPHTTRNQPTSPQTIVMVSHLNFSSASIIKSFRCASKPNSFFNTSQLKTGPLIMWISLILTFHSCSIGTTSPITLLEKYFLRYREPPAITILVLENLRNPQS